MKSLVGNTGFVGSNIAEQTKFEGLYNSKNIKDAFGTHPDLLIYAGIRAEKFLANSDPDKDFEIVKEALENIKKISPQKLVLISTVDIYKHPNNVDEDSEIEKAGLHPYGFNRYWLEEQALASGIDALIVRLPALFGRNLKKNFIFDIINLVPSMLTEQKLAELCEKDDFIRPFYQMQDNGFYKCIVKTPAEQLELKSYFNQSGFSALNFTDSRSVFQFYSLFYLWEHIKIALEHGLSKLNLATAPISAGDIYQEFYEGKKFVNILDKPFPHYDFKTKYAALFGGKNGYIFDRERVVTDVKRFICERK
ncbi:MAG: hypothetical protein K0R57_2119 [Paenibacillaceae bacterium]|jgi:hypothetical protein|nr:hypothetical protein [Paenibacillaceae bacterium]